MDGEWLDEIDFDPDRSWLQMGTRRLGDRPWLVADARREAELAIKQRLLDQRHDEVFAALGLADEASVETGQLIDDHLGVSGLTGAEPARASDLHPLDRAGRLVQEDLCLMAPIDGEWILAAASLCFPTRWRLADKIGKAMPAVHGPVVGYEETLAKRVDGLLDALDDQIVWRRNWSFTPHRALFQPEREDRSSVTVLEAEDCPQGLWLRSERQTLRKLPRSGFVLFTIKIQQEPLAAVIADRSRHAALSAFVAHASADLAGHRGIGAAQRPGLQRAMVAFSPGENRAFFGR